MRKTVLFALALVIGILVLAGCAAPAAPPENKTLGKLPELPSPNPAESVIGAGDISQPSVPSSPV